MNVRSCCCCCFFFSSQTFVVYFWSHCWSLSHMIDIFTGIHLKKIFFLGTWAVLVDVMILSENYWTWKIWQDFPRIQVETTNYTHIICPLKQMHQFSNKESNGPCTRRICLVFFVRDCGPEIAENALKNPLSFTLDHSKQSMWRNERLLNLYHFTGRCWNLKFSYLISC